MSFKLSVCIPTYNRGSFIGETIQSIIDASNGFENLIEIAISDNASNDRTKEVVESFRCKFNNITYFCWDNNMGADRNFLKVVEIASGEYCWLMGSDDKIESADAFKEVFSKLNGDICGISVNSQNYDFVLKNKIKEGFLSNQATDLFKDTYFDSDTECFSYLAPHFGYISAHIVKKSEWDKVVNNENLEPYFNAYVHVYVFGKMLKNSSKWIYLHKRCVGWRSGNDSFLKDGALKRLSIDVYGYSKIVRDLYGNNSGVYKKVIHRVIATYIFHAILGAKVNKASMSFYNCAFRICYKVYKKFPIFWFKVFPLFLMPSGLMLSLRVVYRKFFKHV